MDILFAKTLLTIIVLLFLTSSLTLLYNEIKEFKKDLSRKSSRIFLFEDINYILIGIILLGVSIWVGYIMIYL